MVTGRDGVGNGEPLISISPPSDVTLSDVMVLLVRLLTNRCRSSGLSTAAVEKLPAKTNGEPAMGVKTPLEATCRTFTPPWPEVSMGAKRRFDPQFTS